MLIGLLVASPAPAVRPAPALHRCGALAMAVEANAAAAEEQKKTFFELMPSEVLPEVSLDLRAFRSREKDHTMASIFARQDGTVERWQNVGFVACLDEASISPAVAKQHALIRRWAYEVCNDFETNRLLMDFDRSSEIELAWALPPPKQSPLDALMGKPKPKNLVTEVPANAPFDDALRCGFLGKVSREYRGGGVSARYERIVLSD